MKAFINETIMYNIPLLSNYVSGKHEDETEKHGIGERMSDGGWRMSNVECRMAELGVMRREQES